MGLRLRLSAMILAAMSVGAAALAQAPAPGDITQPNPGAGSIQGRVILPNSPDQPPEQIPVRLSQGSGIPIGVIYTSGNGQFLFSNLPTGRYEVSVTLPGFQRFSQMVDISRGSGRIQMQVHLRRAEEAAQQEAGGRSVSVGEMLAPAGARREYEKGLEKLRKDDSAAAERYFKKAVGLYPAYSRVWVELGQLYARSKRPSEAIESFREALRHDEKDRDALLCMARLLNDQNQYVAALRAAAQLEQIYAGDARNHLEIARGLLGLGKVEEAEMAARQLESEAHLQTPEVHLVLFSIFRMRRHTAAAAGELRTYLKEMEGRGVARGDAAIARARELLAQLESEIAGAK